MWYLAILVAFGVYIINGQRPVPTLDCSLQLYSPSQNVGARTTDTATFSQDQMCQCFRNNPFYLPSDRVRLQAINSNGESIVYDGTIAQLCDPSLRQQGIRLVFPQPSTTYRLRGYVFRNGLLIAQTQESSVTLRSAQDYHTITNNVTHSAGMIAITSILPILFALLLAVFSSMLFMRCCCCLIVKQTKCQQDHK